MNIGVVRHVPNAITLVRPALSTVFVYFILQGDFTRAIPVFAAICLTDISDGATARVLRTCTRFGAYMDVAADLLYVVASLVVLNIKGLAPLWFTAVTVLKFIEFAVTSTIVKRNAGNKSAWIFDGLGRSFSTLVFITPGVICFVAMHPEASGYIGYFLFAPACALGAVSSAVRVTRSGIIMKSRRCFDIEQSNCTRLDSDTRKINQS